MKDLKKVYGINNIGGEVYEFSFNRKEAVKFLDDYIDNVTEENEESYWSNKMAVLLSGDKDQDNHTMYAIDNYKSTTIDFDGGIGVVGNSQLMVNVIERMEVLKY